MKIQINDEVKDRCEDVSLGILIYSAKVEESSSQLLDLFQSSIDELKNKYSMPDIVDMPHIQSTRNAYKALGKSPSEYRNASEAMLRRIIKGNGLYHINNVIEVNNLMSVTTGYSIGSYDTDSLTESVELRRAPDGEKYQGIGKDAVNIEHLPTLYDANGAFGNPTSDSRRAMVQTESHNIMSVIYSFDGESDLQDVMDRYCELLRKYCSVDKIDIILIWWLGKGIWMLSHAQAKDTLGGLMQYDKMNLAYRRILQSLKKIDDLKKLAKMSIPMIYGSCTVSWFVFNHQKK